MAVVAAIFMILSVKHTAELEVKAIRTELELVTLKLKVCEGNNGRSSATSATSATPVETKPCPPPPREENVPEVREAPAAPPKPCPASQPCPAADGGDGFPVIDMYNAPGKTFLDVAGNLPSYPQTDKISVHRYEVIYEKYLGPLRAKKGIKLLEIGIGCGMANGPGRGYELYTKYLPHVRYTAVELKMCKKQLRKIGRMTTEEAMKNKVAHLNETQIEDLITHTTWGSQDNHEVLQRAIDWHGPFDIIIDDASHVPKLTLASFKYLFPKGLKPGGAYIIEDLQVSTYEIYGATKEAQLAHETGATFINDLITYQHFEYWNKDTRVKNHIETKKHLDITEWTRTIECDREICAFLKNHERITPENVLRTGLWVEGNAQMKGKGKQ